MRNSVDSTSFLNDTAKFLVYHQCDNKCFNCWKDLPDLPEPQHWQSLDYDDGKSHDVVVTHVVLCVDCHRTGLSTKPRCLGFDESLRCKQPPNIDSKFCCLEHAESVHDMDTKLLDDDSEDVDRGPSDRFRGHLREAVWYKSNGQCHYCHDTLAKNNWHADHYVPVAQGGQTVLSNGVASCPPCNLNKGATHGDAYKRMMRM